MLEAGRIRLVPPPETTVCESCGARCVPPLEFVAFDPGIVEDVPAGVLETAKASAGHIAYRARSGFGDGSTTTLTVKHLQLCGDCIRAAAEEIGYGDRLPLLGDIDELNSQLEELRRELEQEREQRIDADAALRSLKVFERLLPTGEQSNGDTPKRPQPKTRKGGLSGGLPSRRRALDRG